ncbi:TPA: phosphoserine phosphatase SerB [Neisseria subflava]|uniref:phosphoserine phosphatase SerB n=1 Tax=unclassified Neisseria TaxID=2623750 RepID=UPI0008A5F59A|nr:MULTISPECIES: phosphoserine phosphatase SerB [unclassified Neisseria]OFK85060.1 phosphoserine phosphatase SerB [Neisseria sp. HMSC061E12]OFP77166.1 phosphoserine phosphatase SerB [Neisseria sp. HMSC066B07]OHO82912.1 phosphoserine phosphatase SerB [Neisseria sp. HMSC056A04]OHQ25638.1 phosphoserine phosphatase SerB [Neisseria sp. HMSC066F04]OHR16100.1 phosphoserine phosphatase SerB [Neisseria sp. HMSC078H04]
MKKVLVLQHGDLGACDWSAFGGLVSAPLGKSMLRVPVDDDFELTGEMRAALIAQQIDGAVLPDVAFADLGLIVSDMDSTLITIECVDEIAAGVGLKDEVAAITEQSMRGELDFEQSLRKRVALLAGLDERVLEEVYENVLQLSPGAEFLLEECKRNDVKFMLVSGGFTFFTERLQRCLGLDFHFANVLEVENGKLTGRLKGRIIDAQAKTDLLREYRERLGLAPWQVVAMGDGANDIPMIREAGFGIAYRAKPKTEANADACVRFGGLERIRGWFA